MTEVVGGFLGDLAGIRTIRWSGLGVQAGVDANEQHPDTRHAHDYRNNQHQASSEKTVRRSLRRRPVGFRNSMGVTAGLVGVGRLIHYAPPFCLSDVFFPIRCGGGGVWSDGDEAKEERWGC